MNSTFIILGPPGSGKSTQAEYLAKTFKLNFLSTGNIIHSEINKGGKFGKLLDKYIASGGLVPDKIVIEKILKPKIKTLDCKKGFVFEGIPRNLKQVHTLERYLSKNGISRPWLIYLTVKKETTYKRLALRRFCPVCSINYCPSDLEYKQNKCSRCHKKLLIREDDLDKKAIKKRLNIYHKRTKPVIYYYQTRKKIIKINGEYSIEKIHKDIISKVKKI